MKRQLTHKEVIESMEKQMDKATSEYTKDKWYLIIKAKKEFYGIS